MPKILHDLAKKLEGKPGIDNPWAVATASLQKAGKLERGTHEVKKRKSRRKKRSMSFDDAMGPLPKKESKEY